MRVVRIVAYLVASVVCLPSLALAQAAIVGVVRDTSGAVLPGVTVEAASPALIEKVRIAVTDGTGQFRIENLRPGTYSVTFGLPGFATVVREGVELTGSFTATINADLRVGGVEEPITVTGETPTVDVQGTTRQRVISAEVIQALPTPRSDKNLAQLIPGIYGGAQDVGGTEDMATTTFSVHGSRGDDQRVLHNGMSLGSGSQGGGNTRALTNASALQEVTIDIGAADAEQATGGVRFNFVPRDGGNRFSGTGFYSYGNESMQGSNFTPELEAALGTPDALKRVWDFNPGLGGPIKQDRLWFYAAYKNVGNETYPAGAFNNKNAGNVNAWTYEPDTTSRPFNHLHQWDGQVRLTWQATPKVKTAFSWQEAKFCGCSDGITPTRAPEAAIYQPGLRNRNQMIDWTIPITGRLLFDGGYLYRVQNTVRIVQPGTDPSLISVTEQSLGNFAYRTVPTGAGTRPDMRYGPFVKINYVRSALSFVTGAHSFKAGFNLRALGEDQWYGNVLEGRPQMDFRFNNGVPNQIWLFAYPIKFDFDMDADHGIFVQDRWTLNRLTVSAGVRYDYYKTSYPEQHLGPTALLPNRNFTLAAADGVSWHDWAPKTGLAYDLFGTGKTALKLGMSKYVEGQGNTSISGGELNPAQRLSNVTTRSWNDRTTFPAGDPRNGNYVPDCDLANPAANGECGAMANQNFGRALGATVYDPDMLSGWGIRPYNWEFSAGVQHELMPRVSVDGTFYRRTFGNHFVRDNLLVGPSDYTAFTVTAPTDDRLPSSGQAIPGYLNLNPNKVGQVSDFITLSEKHGGQKETWTGFDIGVVARMTNGLLVQGGTSTGRTRTNTCAIRASLPETAVTNPFCSPDTPFLTQVKFLAAYTVPRIDVQVSGTLQNVPGPAVTANYVATNALVQPSLGRPLSGNAANVTVPLIAPNTLYADRVSQVDVRFGKIIRLGGGLRTAVNLDVYNALNSNAALSVFGTVGGALAWQTPQSIMQARLIKVSAQFDF
jgi:hypothetical protein